MRDAAWQRRIGCSNERAQPADATGASTAVEHGKSTPEMVSPYEIGPLFLALLFRWTRERDVNACSHIASQRGRGRDGSAAPLSRAGRTRGGCRLPRPLGTPYLYRTGAARDTQRVALRERARARARNNTVIFIAHRCRAAGAPAVALRLASARCRHSALCGHTRFHTAAYAALRASPARRAARPSATPGCRGARGGLCLCTHLRGWGVAARLVCARTVRNGSSVDANLMRRAGAWALRTGQGAV